MYILKSMVCRCAEADFLTVAVPLFGFYKCRSECRTPEAHSMSQNQNSTNIHYKKANYFIMGIETLFSGCILWSNYSKRKFPRGPSGPSFYSSWLDPSIQPSISVSIPTIMCLMLRDSLVINNLHLAGVCAWVRVRSRAMYMCLFAQAYEAIGRRQPHLGAWKYCRCWFRK